MRLPLLLVLIAGSSPQESAADERAANAAQVQAIVRQLDDDLWTRRQQAEEALLQLGPDALPLLPRETPVMSAEMRQRLQRVRSQLEAAWASQAMVASRVSLQGEMDLAAALEQLQHATGNTLTGYELFANRPVSLDARQRPFWEVLDQVLDQAQLTLYPYAGHGECLRIMTREQGQSRRSERAHYQGIFRLEPTYIAAVQDLLAPAVSGLRLRVAFAWEPRTRPVSISVPLANLQARDDLGNAIGVEQTAGQLSAAIESDIPLVELEIPLALPSRDAKSLTQVQGTFEVVVPGRSETFEFVDLNRQEGQRQRYAGVAIALSPWRTNGDQEEVTLSLEFDDAAGALESHRGWIYRNDAYLADPQGQRIDYAQRRLTGQDENGIRLTYLFAPDQPLSQLKFVYRTPTLIIRQTLPFELKQIALP